METDVYKTDAVAVIKRFDDAVDAVAKRHKITRGAALLKVAADREMAADWFAYRQAQQVVGAQRQAAPEPAPVVVSDAYSRLMHKAEKRAAKHGTNAATEFAKLYADPARRDLVNQDRSFHITKAAGAGVDPNEQLIIAIMASLGVDRAHASGICLELRSKRPPASTLTHRTRDAA